MSEEEYMCECKNDECSWVGVCGVDAPCPECGSDTEPSDDWQVRA
jgi:hypothetical protein